MSFANIPATFIVILAQFNSISNDPGLQLHNQQHNRTISPSIQFDQQREFNIPYPTIQHSKPLICYMRNNHYICKEK